MNAIEFNLYIWKKDATRTLLESAQWTAKTATPGKPPNCSSTQKLLTMCINDLDANETADETANRKKARESTFFYP